MQDQVTNMIVNKPEFDLSYYLDQIASFFGAHSSQITSGGESIVIVVIGYLIVASIVISILLVFGIVYCVERLKYIRKKEAKIYDAKVDMGYGDFKVIDDKDKKRWENVTRQIESLNENDWKNAIIEADIILGELLVKLGYKGATIGEQLKRVARSDFKTIDQAWEAHKVRNQIAHEGSDFQLNQIDARRIFTMYRQIFEEFSLI